MQDLLLRVWENLIARTEGPFHLRFFIQPSVSLFVAVRAGPGAKQGAVPYPAANSGIKGESFNTILEASWSREPTCCDVL